MKKRTGSPRVQAIVRTLLAVGILIVINILAGYFHARFDLTKEKRYTLSGATKQLLNNLDGQIYVKVYLEGQFPAGFQRLRNATEDMLYEFNVASGGKIQYIFINPTKGTDQEKKALLEELGKKGVIATKVFNNSEEDTKSEQIVVPGLIMTYREREVPLQLLESEIAKKPSEALNSSVELLEYKIASTIKKLTQKNTPRVAFATGEGELRKEAISDFAGTLQSYRYDVRLINLDSVLTLVNHYDVLVIAKPKLKFSEQAKFKIDQFAMNGGSVLWLLDGVNMEMDSMRGKNEFIATASELNLEDQLFRYGVRINANLVQDLRCAPIPLVVGQGNPPQTQLFPWVYFPKVISSNRHPLVRNLDATLMQFASTIDTVRVPDVKKTVLLTSSKYSKALLAPVRIQFEMLKERPNPQTFNQPELPLAVLLEGKFTSVFKNRLAASTLKIYEDSLRLKFKEQSDYCKMIVIADGDVVRNDVGSRGELYPLGYYQYTDQTFANKDLMLNCIEYLGENNNLIETRNKEIHLRLLDTVRLKEKYEKLKWQLINLLVPVLVIILFGFVFNFWRRRKYAH